VGIRKDAFVRDLVRVIIASMQDAQREWAQVVQEVGADPVRAADIIWAGAHRLPNIGYDRISMDSVRDLLRLSHATAPTIDQLPAYFVRYLKSKEGVTGFKVAPSDEKNVLAIFVRYRRGVVPPNAPIEEEPNENQLLLLISKTFRLRELMGALYEYLNKTQIKRDYDRVYTTGSHQRIKFASQKNPIFVYGVILKYLDSLDRGF